MDVGLLGRRIQKLRYQTAGATCLGWYLPNMVNAHLGRYWEVPAYTEVPGRINPAARYRLYLTQLVPKYSNSRPLHLPESTQPIPTHPWIQPTQSTQSTFAHTFCPPTSLD